jgi:hypothetical protein
MIAQKNLTSLFITNTDAATTALPVAAGEFGVRRIGELLCDASALVAGDRFQFVVMNQAGKIVESPIYAWSNLISKNIVNVAALASQVSTIGYNGTDGDIVATNSGNYLVTIGLKDMLKMVGNKRLYKFAEYTAGTTAHNHDIAIALVDSLEANLSKDAFKRVVAKSTCSVAHVNGDCFDDDVYVVKGSKYLTFKTDADYSTNETVVVGDYIRLGAAGVTPGVTSPVYRVTAVSLAHNSTDVITLDRPVTNDTGTYVEGTYDAVVIRKADAEAAAVKWGITLTGNDADAPFEVGKFGNNLIHFSVGVSTDFSTTEVRLGTTPFIGQGTYKEIAQLDWELQGNGREKYRIAEYPVSFTPNITSAWTLTHVRSFMFKDTSTETIGGTADSYMTLMIANTTTSDTNLDTIFTQTS